MLQQHFRTSALLITGQKAHRHKFLWRECKTNIPPEIFVLTSVSFGNRTAGNLATVALSKTADMGRKISLVAVEVLDRGTYVDGTDSFD